MSLLPQRWTGLEQAFVMCWGTGCGSPITIHCSGLLLICCLHEHQQWPLLPHPDALLCPTQVCPPKLSTPLGCNSTCPSVELHCIVRGARVGIRHGSCTGCSSPCTSQISECLPTWCLQECKQWLPLPCSDVMPGPNQLCALQLFTLFSCHSPQPSVELHCGRSRARVGARLGLGCTLGCLQETSQNPRQFQLAFSTLFQE